MCGRFLSAVSAVSASQYTEAYPWLIASASLARLYQISRFPCQRYRALQAIPRGRHVKEVRARPLQRREPLQVQQKPL